MDQTNKYRGTTVTAFVEKYFRLLALLGIFLGLTLLSADRDASPLGQIINSVSFVVVLLIWIALLFQCARARPLTALMELFAIALSVGFVAMSLGWLWEQRRWRAFMLPMALYLILFLLSGEIFPASKFPLAGRRSVGFIVRLLCLIVACLLSYLLLAAFR